MKTDKLFYRLFLARSDLITELIPEVPIDCKFAYSAPAVKEKGFVMDGLLTPVADDPSLPKFPQMSTEEILKMLDLKTADVTQTRFYQEVFQVGEQKGEQKGEQRGEQRGRRAGEIDLILRQLTRQCGVLSPAQQEQIGGLEIEQLEALGEALLDFVGISDLVAWLAEIA